MTNVKTIDDLIRKNHKKENITVFKSSLKDWDWAKAIKASEIATKDGLLIFIKDQKVMYVGQTEYIALYLNTIKYKYTTLKPTTIYVINNENPSDRIMATDAYRAKLNPVLNSDKRNAKYIFDKSSTVLNLSPRYEKIVDWIKRHPNSTRKEFLDIYTCNDIISLCKSFNLIKQSYKDLKAVIASKNKTIRVLNRSI